MFRLLSILWCILACLSQLGGISSAKKTRIFPGRLVPRFDYFTNCETNASLHVRLLMSKIDTVDAEVVINADLVVDRLIRKINQLTLRFQNCDDTTQSSCQHFQMMRFNNDVCSLLGMKDQLWSGVMRSVTPPVKCPQEPGEYRMRNATIDMKIATHLPFPLEKHYWKIRGAAFAPTMVMCVDMGVRFLRRRS